jgi:hypothetical protein
VFCRGNDPFPDRALETSYSPFQEITLGLRLGLCLK